jgi:hypothetical protein
LDPTKLFAPITSIRGGIRMVSTPELENAWGSIVGNGESAGKITRGEIRQHIKQYSGLT